MKKHSQGLQELHGLRFRRRITERVVVEIPMDVIESLERVAVNKDMSVNALIKQYLGQGLRQDTSRQFADQVLQRTAEVLAHRVPGDQVEEIVREIRSKSIV